MRGILAVAMVLSLLGPGLAAASNTRGAACSMAAGECPQAWSHAAPPMSCCTVTPATPPATQVAPGPDQVADPSPAGAAVIPAPASLVDRAAPASRPPARGPRLHLLLTVLLV